MLRPMSAKDIRASVRDFFVAGWTIADIQHALEWMPNSNRWPHSSIPNLTHLNRGEAAVRLRGWLAYRLREWQTSNGEPLYSPSQRAEADRRQQLTFQAIERKRILEEQAQRAAQVNQPASQEKTQALAAINALKSHNRTRAGRNR